MTAVLSNSGYVVSVAMIPKAVSHTAQLLRGFRIVRQGDGGPGIGHFTPEHFTLHICAESQLPCFEDEIATGAIVMEIPLRLIPHQGHQLFFLIADLQECLGEQFGVIHHLGRSRQGHHQ